jgi:hypothetical protein
MLSNCMLPLLLLLLLLLLVPGDQPKQVPALLSGCHHAGGPLAQHMGQAHRKIQQVRGGGSTIGVKLPS